MSKNINDHDSGITRLRKQYNDTIVEATRYKDTLKVFDLLYPILYDLVTTEKLGVTDTLCDDKNDPRMVVVYRVNTVLEVSIDGNEVVCSFGDGGGSARIGLWNTTEILKEQFGNFARLAMIRE